MMVECGALQQPPASGCLESAASAETAVCAQFPVVDVACVDDDAFLGPPTPHLDGGAGHALPKRRVLKQIEKVQGVWVPVEVILI